MYAVIQAVAIASLLLIASCGDDGGANCTPGAQSEPGGAGDPCPQTGTDCAAVGGSAIATCGEGGAYGDCTCVQGQCVGVCIPATCESLGMGTGMATCNAACVLDTTMCTGGSAIGVAGSTP